MDALPQVLDPSIKSGSDEFGSGFSTNLINRDVPDTEITLAPGPPWQSFRLVDFA
jgi:hypothetical protein